MGDRNGCSNPGGGGSALSVVAGAVIGAAGLAWWLLSEAERRRLQSRQPRSLRLTTLRTPVAAEVGTGGPRDLHERDLHDRVHELNQAIDDVRRQLEAMNTQG
jgi:hypothetical protein